MKSNNTNKVKCNDYPGREYTSSGVEAVGTLTDKAEGDDIVYSVWKHTAVHKRTGQKLRLCSNIMWSNYQQYFKKLMQDYVAKSPCNVIMLAHVKTVLNEAAMTMEKKVPIKGALQSTGIEAFFSTVVSARKIPIIEMEKYKNSLLSITEEEEIIGFKHVYQTRLTKETVNERIRASIGMWDTKETFIDNDAQYLLDRLHSYYGNTVTV